ncbi:MAG: DNA cytosine methyltransferase [Candidatus Methanoplasma sp.]|jgi:DNA (cytosine-5)-methyltransferase 1|nr:DNA cytosine methyltransferase [Candidatus Methanoplasma sp.]
MDRLKSIDLFAGIGGIRLGFEQAFGDSIETVFASEWDAHARETYRSNFKDRFEIAGDITKIQESDVPPFDICLAGFPCQAFSLAGQRKGFADDFKGMARGTLFFDAARICAEHRPKVIFCENVKGLAIHDRGRTFEIIKGTLREMGYEVRSAVLNSKDFGVPQNRERIYIVAFRGDVDCSGFEFPGPTDGSKRIRDILEDAPIPSRYYLSERYLETLRRHRSRHEEKGHGFGYVIRGWDDVAGAIVCGGMGRERNLIIDDRPRDAARAAFMRGEANGEGVRKLTPREWARLQGYPDGFELRLADTHTYRQLGNSVTVPVIRAIAERVRAVLEAGGGGGAGGGNSRC